MERELENRVREIITKAVCGSGKKYFRYTTYLQLPEEQVPTQILGTSVTQLKLKDPPMAQALAQDDVGIKVSGSYQLDVWYSFNNSRGTDVARQMAGFEEIVPLQEFDSSSINLVEARALVIKPPQCVDVVIERDNRIRVEVELGFFVEVMGETKIRVQVFPLDESD